ncbi:glycoside hydrolase family 30 protein [Mucilaginibacter jinjuensis]|uniref:Glycoside hydrolase family 30 beta sandwich domain-containing protein n=1 Tax=Mucilaginibacter jinjuensis TaxID=1176721 RepID=A0ABY7T2I1_9SPHI|nr:glycoside hydrolase family 30 beta sandwich domain-containing protein [Mucilaginibacter jinjuensis]WCT10649.1 glycoside hydrolase family 30 beta sandwich domain-containing protein [Mucilaginibacter jinjuensis]
MLNIKKSTLLAAVIMAATSAFAQQKGSVQSWLTNADQSALFAQQKQELPFAKKTDTNPVIEINEKESYQSIDGFGFCLTGGSAQLIVKMDPAKRAELLKELFATDGTNIGISYLRVTIGASDLNPYVFSYDDLPAGETDPNMAKFDLGPDKKDVIPVLKEILAINPKIKILGSSWSPPVWMKTTGDTRGGSLKPEYFDAYAKYLVKYVQSMKKKGITIDAMTVQNEPLHPGNNPSMLMLAPDQANFIKTNLGPMFKAEGIKTKIIVYDHNCDKPEYPISILNDPEAKKYVDGSAFHLYAGKIEALSTVHDAHPDRNLYFTEQWMGAPGNFKRDVAEHITKLTIGATRNWSRNVIEWNLAADPQSNPHTDRGGCDRCMGGITIDKDSVTRNPAYYVVAHAAKFVRPGSVRISSNLVDNLPNVAFKTPDGKKVLVVINRGTDAQTFSIKYKGEQVSEVLNAGSVATYIWK